jgi:hypothetical protein
LKFFQDKRFFTKELSQKSILYDCEPCLHLFLSETFAEMHCVDPYSKSEKIKLFYFFFPEFDSTYTFYLSEIDATGCGRALNANSKISSNSIIISQTQFCVGKSDRFIIPNTCQVKNSNIKILLICL